MVIQINFRLLIVNINKLIMYSPIVYFNIYITPVLWYSYVFVMT